MWSGLCPFSGLVCDLLLRVGRGLLPNFSLPEEYVGHNLGEHCLENIRAVWCLTYPYIIVYSFLADNLCRDLFDPWLPVFPRIRFFVFDFKHFPQGFLPYFFLWQVAGAASPFLEMFSCRTFSIIFCSFFHFSRLAAAASRIF